jgi:hypothetical protein
MVCPAHAGLMRAATRVQRAVVQGSVVVVVVAPGMVVVVVAPGTVVVVVVAPGTVVVVVAPGGGESAKRWTRLLL